MQRYVKETAKCLVWFVYPLTGLLKWIKPGSGNLFCSILNHIMRNIYQIDMNKKRDVILMFSRKFQFP